MSWAESAQGRSRGAAYGRGAGWRERGRSVAPHQMRLGGHEGRPRGVCVSLRAPTSAMGQAGAGPAAPEPAARRPRAQVCLLPGSPCPPPCHNSCWAPARARGRTQVQQLASTALAAPTWCGVARRVCCSRGEWQGRPRHLLLNSPTSPSAQAHEAVGGPPGPKPGCAPLRPRP